MERARRCVLCSASRERSQRHCCHVFLFLLAVAVALHELVHATCGVDELLLTGEDNTFLCDFFLIIGEIEIFL